MSRENTFHSLGLMPALMGLGHLSPAIGAIHTATGEYHFPLRLLTLIGTISAAVDCRSNIYSFSHRLTNICVAMDTYKDLPRSSRPAKWIWSLWIYGLWAIVLACTITLDMETIYDIYRVLPLGLAWGVPCVPLYTTSKGWVLSKPKTLVSKTRTLPLLVLTYYRPSSLKASHWW